MNEKNTVNHSIVYIKNLLPCLLLSIIAGAITGAVIFLFGVCSSFAVSASEKAFAFVRENPAFLPIMLAGAVVLGLISALLVKLLGNCKGGGIPTSIAILRGLIEFKWLRNVFAVFSSAILTYLGGVPLGTEGPCVQMGTAVGRGTVKILAKKHAAWDRYIMTGGACAGFSAAIGAPITGIFFAFEEAHRRFSPMIFMSAATASISGYAVTGMLNGLSGRSSGLFVLPEFAVLPIKSWWAPLLIGIVCGLAAIGFTKLYRVVSGFMKKKLRKLSVYVKIPAVFLIVALIGCVITEVLGSGHSIVELMIEGRGVWYMIILYFLIRMLLLIIANACGITGGLFLPTLAFGAMIGSLCGKAMLAMGVIEAESFPVMVIIGIASFLAAASRIPITALVFAAEVLSSIQNILPIAIGVTVAYVVIEASGITSFTETVVERKVSSYRGDRVPVIIDVKFTVKKGAFAVGKEIKDILWPPTCVVTSVRKNPETNFNTPTICEGDVLHLHYKTYDQEETFRLLTELIGQQSDQISPEEHKIKENHQVPEI